MARFPAHWARWLARRPASGVGSAGREGGGAGLGVRCVSFDLDETCWPTTPPIVQVSSGAGLRKRSLTCRHSWGPWTLARRLRHPRLPHLFPTFPPSKAQQVLVAMVAESLPNVHAAGAISQMGSIFATIRAEQPLVSGARRRRWGVGSGVLRHGAGLHGPARGGHLRRVPHALPRRAPLASRCLMT